MGDVIELHRFRDTDHVVSDRAPPSGPPYVLPFLWWRSAIAAWSSLWLVPLGLRVEVIDAEPARPVTRRGRAG